MTEESCSPSGYCASDNAVEDVLISVVDSAQLADLLLEVRVCRLKKKQTNYLVTYRIQQRIPRASYLMLIDVYYRD